MFETPGEDIRATAYRLKWVSVLLFVVPSLALFWFAHEIIAVLFDHRYSEAAWIFQLYIVGMLPHFVSGLGNFTLAFGNSKASASLSLVNFVLFFSCMLLGWYLFGEMGIVFAVALSGGFLYFFQIAWQEKYGLWFSWFDLAVYAVICIVLGLKIS